MNTFWLARDKNGTLCLYVGKPRWSDIRKMWKPTGGRPYFQLDRLEYPDINYKNSPVKVKFNTLDIMYTEKDLVSFGNYLLSEERRESIENEELVSVVGDWDIKNWEGK